MVDFLKGLDLACLLLILIRSPSSDYGGCVVRGPSPPLLVVLLVIFHRGKVCQSPVSGSRSALNYVLDCRTWFARSIVDLSMFLRNFSVPVGPAELRSPLGVVALFPQGLTRDLCVPFGLRLSGFLPGHRSSS